MDWIGLGWVKLWLVVQTGGEKSHIFYYIRVSRRRREMYFGHARLCVCLSVRGRMPTLLHGPGCNLGSGRGCPLIVQYWADLQSVHGLRCYGNITRTRNVSEYMLVLALCLVAMLLIAFCQCLIINPVLYTKHKYISCFHSTRTY